MNEKYSLFFNFCPKRKSSLDDHTDKIATNIIINTNNNNNSNNNNNDDDNEVLVGLMLLRGFRYLMLSCIDSFPYDPSLSTIFIRKSTSLNRPTFLVNTLSHVMR